jgi:Tfp pilus assembly protein PilO
MKRITSRSAVFICAALLCAGCATTHNDETSEMRRGMRQQMMAVRTQMRASGASAAQLRDFDKAVAEMDRMLRQMEKQMRALENQAGH